MNAFAFRRTRWALAILAGAVTVFLATSSLPRTDVRAEGGDDAGDESRIRQGFAISPAAAQPRRQEPGPRGPGQLLRQRRDLVRRLPHEFSPVSPGRESVPGPARADQSRQLLEGEQTVPGRGSHRVSRTPSSRSLRPENGLPAGLTLDQFVDVMRNGTDYDHPGRLLQVMGWPIFQNMTDRDLLAIYAYLSTLPPQ